MSIRESMNRAIENRAIIPATRSFGLDEVGGFERIALPLAPVFGQAADFLTTRQGLRRGLGEANPLMKGAVRNMAVFGAIKLGLGAIMAVSVKKLQDRDHKRAARIVSVVGTLTGAGPAISNLRMMGKL